MTRVLAGCLAGLLVPVLLAAVVGSGDPTTLWSALAVMTGAQAVVALVLAFAAAARIRCLTTTLGLDTTIGAHRALGAGAVALSVVHVLAVLADNPANVWLLDPSVAPGRSIAATYAFVLLVLLLGFATRRTRHYEGWRWAHRLVAVAALVLVALHIGLLHRLVYVPAWAVFYGTLLLAVLAVGTWRWLAPVRRYRFLVSAVRDETPSVSTLTLTACRGGMSYAAGQFAWLRLHARPWAQDHPFTLSSAPEDAGSIEVTFRHAGDWTTGPLRALRPGSVVWLDGPHGALTLRAVRGAPGLVMIAVGAGLTPALSLLRACARRQDTRPLCVLVPPGEPLFAAELRALTRHLDLSVRDALPRHITPTSLPAALPDRAWIPRAAYLVCGPPGMVTATRTALRTLGVPADRIHTERFVIA